MFAPIKTCPLPDFRLTFFGNAGLDAKGGSVASLTSIASPTDDNAPSLPWFFFGTHFDNVISCEVVCPAWLIPAKKFKNTFAERVKEREKAKCQSEEGKKVEFAGLDYDPEERSGLDLFAAETIGTRRAQAKAKGKAKAATKAKGKAKAKAKGKAVKNGSDIPLTFMDEALFPGVMFVFVLFCCSLFVDIGIGIV